MIVIPRLGVKTMTVQTTDIQAQLAKMSKAEQEAMFKAHATLKEKNIKVDDLNSIEKDTSQVIGGWKFDVKKLKPKIKDGVATGGVSGGMVTIENRGINGAKGANGHELVTNPNMNIELVLMMFKHRDEILKYLLSDDKLYRHCGQKSNQHLVDHSPLTVQILENEGYVTKEMLKIARK